MTVNDNEFYAALYYMVNKNIENQDYNTPKSLTVESGTRYFIGNFANIPTALVQHKQGSSESQHVAGEAFELFSNLKAVVAVGVCGTFGELGDVVVSSKIVGYENIKYDKDGKILGRDPAPDGSRLLTSFLLAQNNWKFNCTKENSSVQCISQFHNKPFLSASTLVAYQNFRDKIREDVCREALGIEMEGIGVVKAKEFNVKYGSIQFIIVKAGCDYANEEKNKEWQPVAAMAAADLVYYQFGKPAARDWFTGNVRSYAHTYVRSYFNSVRKTYVCICTYKYLNQNTPSVKYCDQEKLAYLCNNDARKHASKNDFQPGSSYAIIYIHVI